MITAKFKTLSLLMLAESIERFSYYFVSFLIQAFMLTSLENGGLGLAQNFSAQLSGYFSLGILAFPLALAPFIDKYFGCIKSALVGGIFLLFGYLIAFFSDVLFNYSIVLSLFLLILGSSLVKPSLSVLVGKYAGVTYKVQEFSYILFIIIVSISSILSAFLSAKLLNEILVFKPLFMVSFGLMVLFNLIIFYILKKEKNTEVKYFCQHNSKNAISIMTWSLFFCLLIGLTASVSGRIFTYPNALGFWFIAFMFVILSLVYFFKKVKVSKFLYYMYLVFLFLLFYIFCNLFLREIGLRSPIIPSIYSGFDMLNNFFIFPLCLAFIMRFSPPKALVTIQAFAFFLFSLGTIFVKNVLPALYFSPISQLILLAVLTVVIFFGFLNILFKVANKVT